MAVSVSEYHARLPRETFPSAAGSTPCTIRRSFRFTFLTGAVAGATLVWAQTAEKKDPAAPTSPAAAKLAAAQEVFRLDEQRHAAGFAADEGGVEFQHTWSVRLMEAEREAADATPDARRQASQRHLDRMQTRAKQTENLYSVGHANKIDVLATRYFVAEAQRWLQEADRKP